MRARKWFLSKGGELVAQRHVLSVEIDEWLEATQAILADPDLDANERYELQELRRRLRAPST